MVVEPDKAEISKMTPELDRFTPPVNEPLPVKAKVPPLIVVVPVNVLAPARFNVLLLGLVSPPVPWITPLYVVVVDPPTLRVLLPSVTVDPDTPANSPIAVELPEIPLILKSDPDALTVTMPVVEREPDPVKERDPALIVVPPV